MESILNFQVPAEGLEMVILLHAQYKALRHHKLIINDDSQPNFFLYHFGNYFQFFFTKRIFKSFHFWKKINFSEKMPSDGLELVILLHTQY